MDLNQNLSDAHDDESSTPREAQAINVTEAIDTTDAKSPEQAVVLPPKRGKKGKYQGQTGPRSKRGKEASRNNCKMTHGLRAKKLLMPFEDPKEYEKHLAGIIRTLKPQDAVEHGIVDAYAYALWTSPRFESYEQAKASTQFEDKVCSLGPQKIVEKLGLSNHHQIHAPAYLSNLEYEISPERIDHATFLLECYSKIQGSMEGGDPHSLDWLVTLECYPELFEALDKWLVARGDEITVFGEDGKTLHPYQLENPDGLWSDLEGYAYFLFFEVHFMRLKPQIALILERMYWRATYKPFPGFSDHFVKSQNFAFVQLERLAAYRKMKKKFENLPDEEVEEG
jgi:hypothetical protein